MEFDPLDQYADIFASTPNLEVAIFEDSRNTGPTTSRRPASVIGLVKEDSVFHSKCASQEQRSADDSEEDQMVIIPIPMEIEDIPLTLSIEDLPAKQEASKTCDPFEATTRRRLIDYAKRVFNNTLKIISVVVTIGIIAFLLVYITRMVFHKAPDVQRPLTPRPKLERCLPPNMARVRDDKNKYKITAHMIRLTPIVEGYSNVQQNCVLMAYKCFHQFGNLPVDDAWIRAVAYDYANKMQDLNITPTQLNEAATIKYEGRECIKPQVNFDKCYTQEAYKEISYGNQHPTCNWPVDTTMFANTDVLGLTTPETTSWWRKVLDRINVCKIGSSC